jgi:hypothetical protein
MMHYDDSFSEALPCVSQKFFELFPIQSFSIEHKNHLKLASVGKEV